MPQPLSVEIQVRIIDGCVYVLVPAGPNSVQVGHAIRELNVWRGRNGRLPIPMLSDLARELIAAGHFADLITSVPPAEQALAVDTTSKSTLITTAAAAPMLGISARGVRQRISRGLLRAQRVGATWLIRPEDLHQDKERAA